MHPYAAVVSVFLGTMNSTGEFSRPVCRVMKSSWGYIFWKAISIAKFWGMHSNFEIIDSITSPEAGRHDDSKDCVFNSQIAAVYRSYPPAIMIIVKLS